MSAISPLQKEFHAYLKINDSNMEHAQYQNVVPVLLHEFARACLEYPIVFVKNAETGQFQAVCVVGFRPNENKFVKNKQWVGGYIPLSVRNAPLCLVPQSQNPDQLFVGINETSARIDLDHGTPLFTASGDESEFLAARKIALIDYYEKDQVSQQITQLLANKGLLSPQTINLSVNDESLSLAGVYLIDEEKLNALSEQEFLDLRKRGVLPAIYAHLISSQQWERIARFNMS